MTTHWQLNQSQGVKMITGAQKTIYDSLSSLEQFSCFRFQQRATEKDFLVLIPLDGCYSYVGKIGSVVFHPQFDSVLSLAVDCIADCVIWHEVMHAIGFEHEHQRPDRDQSIHVEFRNAQRGQLGSPLTNQRIYKDYNYFKDRQCNYSGHYG
uniref:Metalloendopeptidase n=1 Tax=Angiostrongylus cantonensis TaxID=6313 RepID=A0A0K0D897_ANGCA